MAQSGVPPIHALGFQEARHVLAAMQAGPVAAPSVRVEDMTFPVGPTGRVDVRLFRPSDDNCPQPAVIYLHGGGWVMGGKHTHDRLLRELAVGTGATFVFVDYALAPEAHYPVQNEQAYGVLTYIRDNAAVLGIDGARIAVAGDCAGGNIAAALTLLAKRRRGPEIAFQLLFYPLLDDGGGSLLHESFGDGPWLTRQAKAAYLNAVMPDPASRTEVTAFPLKASLVQLNDLPQALVLVAEHDIARDEGEAYVRKLVRAGVTATCTRCNNTIHDFVVLNALADVPVTRYAIAQATAALSDALYRAH
ncbi:MAG: alpha/beta hydrolase [Acetobacteraceae bacterium]|nr:alpha/beta hydrolase [Acetobacteraceae bacterium]